ncbi:MAG: OmpA/MotB family protein, partial [Planctomycetota bacterium]
RNKGLGIGLCLICSIVISCIPKTKYLKLETELKNARLASAEKEKKIHALEQHKNKLLEEIKSLQDRYEYSTKIAQQLYDNIQTLSAELKKRKLELDKKKSVIGIQDQVIKLLDDTKKTIEFSLKNKIAAQEVEVVSMTDTLKVVLIDKILYDSGTYNINDSGKKLLMTLAKSFKDNKNQQIVVEGHTDNVPLGADLRTNFPSNWELSAARAAAVVRFLQKEGGLEPQRLSVRGYSYYKPVASNNNEKGRRQNRRIEIILKPNQ